MWSLPCYLACQNDPYANPYPKFKENIQQSPQPIEDLNPKLAQADQVTSDQVTSFIQIKDLVDVSSNYPGNKIFIVRVKINKR